MSSAASGHRAAAGRRQDARPPPRSAGLADPGVDERPRVRGVGALVAPRAVARERVDVRGVAEHVGAEEGAAARIPEARSATRLRVVLVDLERHDLVLDALEVRRREHPLRVDELLLVVADVDAVADERERLVPERTL